MYEEFYRGSLEVTLAEFERRTPKVCLDIESGLEPYVANPKPYGQEDFDPF